MIRPSTEFPVSLQEFVSWMRKQKPNAIVGYRQDEQSCPCVRCLQEITGEVVSVGTNTTDIGAKTYSHPDWLRTLVIQIDTSGSIQSGVRAHTVLRFLEYLTQQG